MMNFCTSKKIAILLPCYNEEVSIGVVIDNFKQVLPNAEIWVCDNNSTDETVLIAKNHGANIMYEYRQGKGNVVRRMFADIEADIYVMADGDATYDIESVGKLIKILEEEHLDMVVGARKEKEKACYRKGHRLGNVILTKMVDVCFNYKLRDMLSGYRVFSRRFVKTFPAKSNGFEIETELTVFALSAKLPMKEVDTNYFARLDGSESKLSTYRDGMKIFKTIIALVKDERPMMFFSVLACICFVFGVGLSIPLIIEFISSGLVPRLPTAVLVVGIVICGVLSLLIGLVLDSISTSRQETRRQSYLRFKR